MQEVIARSDCNSASVLLRNLFRMLVNNSHVLLRQTTGIVNRILAEHVVNFLESLSLGFLEHKNKHRKGDHNIKCCYITSAASSKIANEL